MNQAESVTAGIKPSALTVPTHALPHRALGRGFTLLEGVRVIDLTTSVAGPLATTGALTSAARASNTGQTAATAAIARMSLYIAIAP